MAYRTCSECPNSLAGKGPHAITCSPACRAKRSRRLKAQRVNAGKAKALPDHQALVTGIVRDEIEDAAKPLVQEELRPVVRESITEDTLRAIQRMVALTPDAVAALEEDLSSENATIRQRAYTLVMKYTVGHPAVVRPEDADPNQQLVVHMHMPRPGDEIQDADVVTELRECSVCGAHKAPHEFVANSDRCNTCHEQLQARARHLLDQQEPDSASG